MRKRKRKERVLVIYVISNPSFNGWLKIGRSWDLSGRLSTYQCGDPFKAYKVEFSIEIKRLHKIREIETYFKDNHSNYETGEWVKMSVEFAIKIIKTIEGLD